MIIVRPANSTLRKIGVIDKSSGIDGCLLIVPVVSY